MQKQIEELTLLLLYLTGWEEDSRKNPGEKLYCTWNGYSFRNINTLSDEKLILRFKDKKIIIITKDGQEKAEYLKKKYLGEQS